MSRFSGISIFLVAATVLAAFVLLSAIPVVAQATISTGSIQGTITDPQGAVVPGAKIIVSNRGTGQKLDFTTSSTGAFATGALIPGDYIVRVESKGFQSVEKPVTVEVGVIAPANIKMTIGLTSSGEVNVTTRSGTNNLHGQGFYLYRDKDAGLANFPGGQNLPFQRHQFGGSLGGPIVKDKLFFFINAERVKQDALTPVTFN